MSVQRFLQTKRVTEFGLGLARRVPPFIGYALSWLFAAWMGLRKTELYHTVYHNLRHVLGPDASPRKLHDTAVRTFRHAGRTYYDFFHTLGQPVERVAQAVTFQEGFIENLSRYREQGRGVVVMALHTSNFDLAALALAANGFHCQALSVPNPSEGFQIANEIRIRCGHDITPISPGSLRKAVRRLRDGGIAVMGVDYPQPQEEERPLMFGQPSYLPVGSARLALLSDVPSIIVSCHYDKATGYTLHASEPFEMIPDADRDTAIMANTQRIARIVEEYIRQCPEQWLMFHPFWPADGSS